MDLVRAVEGGEDFLVRVGESPPEAYRPADRGGPISSLPLRRPGLGGEVVPPANLKQVVLSQEMKAVL